MPLAELRRQRTIIYARHWRLIKRQDPQWVKKEMQRRNDHYQNNKEKYKRNCATWQMVNKERLQELKHNYYMRNREKIKKKNTEYYQRKKQNARN